MIREAGTARVSRPTQGPWRRLLALQDCCLCRGCSRGALLCGFCRRDLPRCPSGLDRARLARRCGLDWIGVRFDYRFPLDCLLTRFKYAEDLALAPALAALLPAPRWPPGRPAPALLPVPSSAGRMRRRGYDHLALLARHFARREGLVQLAAWRVREAPAQAGLGRRARRDNLKGAFAVPGAPADVLLLDDVVTTGATLAALAEACRAAGARRVGAVVLARTPAAAELLPDPGLA